MCGEEIWDTAQCSTLMDKTRTCIKLYSLDNIIWLNSKWWKPANHGTQRYTSLTYLHCNTAYACNILLPISMPMCIFLLMTASRIKLNSKHRLDVVQPARYRGSSLRLVGKRWQYVEPLSRCSDEINVSLWDDVRASATLTVLDDVLLTLVDVPANTGHGCHFKYVKQQFQLL